MLPGTAGKPPYGTRLALLDENNRPVPRGEIGRIFVGNEMQFEGYTNGNDKERALGLMSTGDRGVLDENNLLTVLGRDDDMVIVGGENVYPIEVEELPHRPAGGEGGRRRRRPGRVARVAAGGVPRPPRRRARSPRRTCAGSCASGWRSSRCRGTSCSSRPCRATRPARSCRGCCRRRPGRSGRSPDGFGPTPGPGPPREPGVVLVAARPPSTTVPTADQECEPTSGDTSRDFLPGVTPRLAGAPGRWSRCRRPASRGGLVVPGDPPMPGERSDGSMGNDDKLRTRRRSCAARRRKASARPPTTRRWPSRAAATSRSRTSSRPARRSRTRSSADLCTAVAPGCASAAGRPQRTAIVPPDRRPPPGPCRTRAAERSSGGTLCPVAAREHLGWSRVDGPGLPSGHGVVLDVQQGRAVGPEPAGAADDLGSRPRRSRWRTTRRRAPRCGSSAAARSRWPRTRPRAPRSSGCATSGLDGEPRRRPPAAPAPNAGGPHRRRRRHRPRPGRERRHAGPRSTRPRQAPRRQGRGSAASAGSSWTSSAASARSASACSRCSRRSSRRSRAR